MIPPNSGGGGYRKRFKAGKLEPGETPAQFAELLKRYLEKWRNGRF